MNSIQIFNYNDTPIQFEIIGEMVYANATAMCKPFNKDLSSILRTKQWEEMEQTVGEDLQLNSVDLRRSKPGSPDNGGGTWVHEELVIELARRLSSRFGLWCNRRIAELHKQGTVSLSLSRKDMAKMIWEAEEEKERLALENQQLKELRQVDQPKVEFYEAVTDSKDATDLGTVAKLLNMRGIGRTKLFSTLREKGILMKNNRPYQEYVDRGWFRIIESSWTKPNGTQHVYFKTVAFQKGVEGIRNLLAKPQPVSRSLSLTSHDY